MMPAQEVSANARPQADTGAATEASLAAAPAALLADSTLPQAGSAEERNSLFARPPSLSAAQPSRINPAEVITPANLGEFYQNLTTEVIAYHGTSANHLGSIAQNGLNRAASEVNAETWGKFKEICERYLDGGETVVGLGLKESDRTGERVFISNSKSSANLYAGMSGGEGMKVMRDNIPDLLTKDNLDAQSRQTLGEILELASTEHPPVVLGVTGQVINNICDYGSDGLKFLVDAYKSCAQEGTVTAGSLLQTVVEFVGVDCAVTHVDADDLVIID